MKYLSEDTLLKVKKHFSFLGTVSFYSQFGGYSMIVNNIMFALILEKVFYLRANIATAHLFHENNMKNLVYKKRGIPVILKYYCIDNIHWNTPDKLRKLILVAYQEAKNKKEECKINLLTRLKDLPNLNINLERLLWKAGIESIAELKISGAKSSYLKLRKIKKSLGIKTLFALAGAITGEHSAVLPYIARQELTEWFNKIDKKE